MSVYEKIQYAIDSLNDIDLDQSKEHILVDFNSIIKLLEEAQKLIY